jgi:tetratricopeptide (TPR) repeat protein
VSTSRVPTELTVSAQNWARKLWDAMASVIWFPARFKAHRYRKEALKAYTAGNAPQATELMRTAIKCFSRDPDLHTDLGQMYFELAKYTDSETCFRTALEYDYDHWRALKGLGFALQEQGKQSEAIYFYLRYLREGPADSDVLLNLGAALHAIGKYNQALRYYEQAGTYSPQNPIILENMARSLYSLGRFDEAIFRVRESIKINPRNEEAQKLLGLCLESKGEPEGALTAYLLALEDQPSDGELRLRIAELLDDSGRYKESLEHSLRAAEIFEASQDRNSMARAFWDVGWAYYRLKELQLSIDASARAVELWPDLYQARFNLALALLQLGRQEEAMREYRRAADRLAPAEIQYWAIDDLEEALEENPDSQAISEALALLKNLSNRSNNEVSPVARHRSLDNGPKGS